MIEALRSTGVRFAILGVAAYLVFLAANLPAAWFGYVIERASGGKLVLGDSRGTVWKGRGTLAASSGDGFRSIADIEWRCSPLSVFSGRLGVEVSGSAPGASLKGNVSFGLRSVRFQKVEASAPATLLAPAVPAAAFFKPEGQLRVSAESLDIGADGVRGAATAEWSGAGLMGVARIGEYRLQITGSGERAGVKLATPRGDLRVNGDGEWRAAQPRVVQMRGVAETSPERKDLEPLLQWIAGGGAGSSRQFAWMLAI